ncbi:alpha-(1,3)-fucosyltransferase C-like [Bacillus rossius redtenbacheri]|uniref:alpha-(1,3)-fucosyltransferase C-like n=1 Tax=Bacillus rossius redtenbacheri TaxID=93214 RepID=UPI002FDEC1F7
MRGFKKLELWSYTPTQKSFLTFTVAVMVVCFCYFEMYSSAITLFVKAKLSLLKPNSQFNKENQKTILFWNSFYSLKHFMFGVGHNPFIKANRPISNCIIVDRADGDLPIPVEDFDVIVFHINGVSTLELPKQRKINQWYIYFNLESPINTKVIHKTDSYDDNYFNWTMTYRRSSDLYYPYGWVAPISNARKVLVLPSSNPPQWIAPNYSLSSADPSLNVLLGRKTKLVAWFVSNCDSNSKRFRYVEALSKFVPVDIYGKCGKLKCPKGSRSCDKMLETTYKFYLSFENSLCLDYVTEKFFRALKYYVIPIAYGGCNYSLIAPPNSYIDVSAFPSPKELAAYIIYLDKNSYEYNKYFWWKYFYTVMDDYKYVWCQLCQMVNNSSLPSKTYNDISSWWSENMCYIDHKKNTFL